MTGDAASSFLDSLQSHQSRAWTRRWAATTLFASVAVTTVDAALLQRKHTYFSGGFLSVDHASRLSDALAFFAGSLAADAAVTALFVAVVLWGCGLIAVRRNAAVAMALVAALTPLVGADVASYELNKYLGDAFDLSLMFDLVGRSPRELWAVSSAHLVTVLPVLVVASVLIPSVVWLSRRGSATTVIQPIHVRVPAVLSLMMLLIGLVATTALRISSDVLDNGLRRKPAGKLLGSVVEIASDVDRDGYGVLGRPSDPDTFNARVAPYALDMPGNGMDEDGVGGDLPASVAPYIEPIGPEGRWSRRPNVVFVMLESFRADMLGATLGGKPVTPTLDRLAARGVSTLLAFSHNGYTAQSRHHLFSGSVADIRGPSSLVDEFKANGYETAYFSAQDESFGGPTFGVGFDRADVAYDARVEPSLRYSTYTTAGSLALSHEVLNHRIREFLDKRHSDRPLFLYVNFHDTHFPYHHRGIKPIVSDVVLRQSEIAPWNATQLHAMYMNTAANVDRAVGDFLDHVRQTLGSEPGVIVMADHGESLFEEDFLGHGYALNDVQTRIPFIVTGLPLAIEEPFGQADLRDAIAAALTQGGTAEAVPTIARNRSRRVFQYLGRIERPVEIAFRSVAGRVIYDFRNNQVSLRDGEWRAPGSLDPAGTSQFLELVRTWERMMLARHSAGVAE